MGQLTNLYYLNKMTTQKQIRAAFWQAHRHIEAHARKWGIKTAPQSRHNATTRTAFCDFVDYLARTGEISEALAFRATL
jgi:L,D-peptidoglycan transpeptidase YkuD (ErfK/YbiS/YcfS/YnhG family)